ncbi:hypothetical protein HCA53_00225 [Listeria innocua]|uniref:AbiH family protein n=1 Tax=Listeria innocua TaxID=1642 RepID=UPI0016279B72|nr:AbiH family protein [Listeria innocua]MBC1908192.1 hypothetical protein [Listeria innocua]MBC1927088.1 hypothetical protein [Listeria innocua]
MNDNEVTKKETGLIIIGNGLDINSGLSSRFIQYYKARCANLGLIINENYNLVDGNAIQVEIMFPGAGEKHAIRDIVSVCGSDELIKSITFWDLILIYSTKISGNENWCNIEKMIFDVIKDLSSYLHLTLKEFILVLGYPEVPGGSSVTKQGLLALTSEFNEIHRKYIWFLAYIEIIRKDHLGYQGISIERFLLLELNKYEQGFLEYMDDEIMRKSSYSYLRSNSIKAMIDNNKNLTNINIMNFNFTCGIFDDIEDRSVELSTEVNVHGKVDILDESKIIFGIDKKSLDREGIKAGYDLTKTSRKLVMNEIKIASVLDNTISNIIFYGHSLSEADYAYFQSIFDYLDIYNNQIQLTFYYTNYLEDEQDFETVRREQVTAVRTLIEEYGSTLDNEAKGKNLLHKLLLEERISVFEL